MLEEIREELFNLQDLKYQKFHAKLCPGVDNIIGVRAPELKKLAKKILKQDAFKYIEEQNKEYYEEIMLEGILIASCKTTLENKFKYLDKFIPTINCWAITDSCAASFKLSSEKDKMWNYLEKYQNSKEEYELRFMIVMWMDHYLTDDYIDEVLKRIDRIKSDDYYVKMAIAWLISIAYIKFPQKTLNYLNNNNLSIWTFNKSLQKIIESNRVSKEEKALIKSMKKKIK